MNRRLETYTQRHYLLLGFVTLGVVDERGFVSALDYQCRRVDNIPGRKAGNSQRVRCNHRYAHPVQPPSQYSHKVCYLWTMHSAHSYQMMCHFTLMLLSQHLNGTCTTKSVETSIIPATFFSQSSPEMQFQISRIFSHKGPPQTHHVDYTGISGSLPGTFFGNLPMNLSELTLDILRLFHENNGVAFILWSDTRP